MGRCIQLFPEVIVGGCWVRGDASVSLEIEMDIVRN